MTWQLRRVLLYIHSRLFLSQFGHRCGSVLFDMRADHYLPVREEEEGKGIDWNSGSEIIPTNTRGFITYISILLISLSMNVLLVLHHFPQACSEYPNETSYSKLLAPRHKSYANEEGGLSFDTLIPYHSFSRYWNPSANQSVADQAWDALETNPIAVTLHSEHAKDMGLAPSTRFPWDNERSVYYVKGFHDLHCLVQDPLHTCIFMSKELDRNSSAKLLFRCTIKRSTASLPTTFFTA